MDEMKRLLGFLEGLYEKIQENPTRDRVQQLLDEIEPLFVTLSAEYGYDSDALDEITLCLQQKSIQKLAQLEEKIKHAHPASLVQEQSKKISKTIRDFWEECKFHSVPDIYIDASGSVEVQFGFALDFGVALAENKSEAKEQMEQNKRHLVEEGYVLNEDDKELLDCDDNKEKIRKIIMKRFPSAAIMSWESMISMDEPERHNLEKVRVIIPEVTDICR